jgi:glycosyltransferase involved in cell wall biosynthesis
LYAGALVEEKGADTAIEAMRYLPEMSLLIAGDGPERRALEQRSEQSAPGRITFLGSVDEMKAVYENADVVVLPSRGGDSMPAVLIEAGLMGIPCVSTDVEAIAEIVIDGVSGRLVKPDSPSALADGIEDAVANAARYGTASRSHCLENFDIGVVASGWDRLIQSQIERATQR